MRTLFLITSILCTLAFGQNAKPRFVVSVSGELQTGIADVLADEISYAIIKSGKYDLLANDRQFKETLKKEFQQGNVSDDKIIGLAKKAGADYLCFAKVTSVLGSNQVTAQLVDLTTMFYGSMGKANGRLSELDHLTEISQKVVADMLGFAVSSGIGGGTGSVAADNTFTDSRDGKKYRTVKIGSLVWMAENLNYNSGTNWCYANDDFNCRRFGRLYDWNTARSICPQGWHLPSQSEWSYLVQNAGGDVAGTKLKAKSPSWNGTDDFGFSALPGGSRNAYGGVGTRGFWWSATESGRDAFSRSMGSSNESVLEGSSTKAFGFSVRCVQD
ncbi:MAG: hypothetical protein LBU89_01180 [Fibromonadaceae bacterium]|jgi:uncharacterized protein (TIGR02145 family)|nr:hypothetical protein [Fibromonadaceae bacterium]